MTRCPDAQPSRWAPGQASHRPWLQRGPLIARLRCSARPFTLPENSPATAQRCLEKAGLVMFSLQLHREVSAPVGRAWHLVGDSNSLTRRPDANCKGRTALQWLLLLTIHNQSHNQSYILGLSVFFKYFRNTLDTNRAIKILDNCR